MVQINQATQQLISVTGGESSMFYGQGWIFGTLMAIIVGIVILGGIKSIAKVTDKIVPFMVGIYILGALRRGITPEINAVSTILVGVSVLLVLVLFLVQGKMKK